MFEPGRGFNLKHLRKVTFEMYACLLFTFPNMGLVFQDKWSDGLSERVCIDWNVEV